MIIQFDFDGTLALGDNTRLEDMYPNVSAINLCNRLYDDGNTIHICTARGSKSCNTIEQRIKKYKTRLEDWLSAHNVKYHSLSFMKEYADAYIDDRAYNAYTPLDYQLLDAGFTDNKVTRLNDRVIKVGKGALNEKKWYARAKELGLKIPTVYHADQDTIMMQYIDGQHKVDVGCYLDTLMKFSQHKPMNTATFHHYINKIQKHVDGNPRLVAGDKLMAELEPLEVESTFAHGDFSIMNLLNTGGVVYMIDPIYDENNFQSYVIDIAKNLFSILFYANDYRLYSNLKDAYSTIFKLNKKTIDVLIACEAVRVATYKQSFTDVANNLIDTI